MFQNLDASMGRHASQALEPARRLLLEDDTWDEELDTDSYEDTRAEMMATGHNVVSQLFHSLSNAVRRWLFVFADLGADEPERDDAGEHDGRICLRAEHSPREAAPHPAGDLGGERGALKVSWGLLMGLCLFPQVEECQRIVLKLRALIGKRNKVCLTFPPHRLIS